MIWMESLLESLSEKGICYSDTALTLDQKKRWLEVFQKHRREGLFKPASIGRQATLQQDSTLRNDLICWLEPSRADDQEILAELEKWRIYLNETLFLSTRTTEAHFACYDPGHFYTRHKDRHDSSSSRILTFVVYLHDQWKSGDGGELAITAGDTDQVLQIINPLPGRVVLFRSDEIWHEVRKSYMERASLTGWFRYDSVDYNNRP